MAAQYATTDDLRLYGIAGGSLASIPLQDQQAALDAVSAHADSLIGARFSLPLEAPYSPDLARAIAQIAAYDLISVRGFNPDSKMQAEFKLRAERAEAWLEGISAGNIVPGWGDADALNATSDGPFVAQPIADSDGLIAAGPSELRGW